MVVGRVLLDVMAIDLPPGWREVDRNDEFSADPGMMGQSIPANRVFEGSDGLFVIVYDELDKPLEDQRDPRFVIKVAADGGAELVYGHTESTHERMEAAVGALVHVAHRITE